VVQVAEPTSRELFRNACDVAGHNLMIWGLSGLRKLEPTPMMKATASIVSANNAHSAKPKFEDIRLQTGMGQAAPTVRSGGFFQILDSGG
jgi:hypothetical protein